MELYHTLFRAFGPQGWWPARTPFEVVVGAILTQSVAWTNVERAIANLKAAGLLTPDALETAPAGLIASHIRPAGYFNAKARKLKAFLDFLRHEHGGALASLFDQPLSRARPQLLAVWGVGPETADSILLYAGGLPTFVVDAYTGRILARLGLLGPQGDPPAPPPPYETLRGLFQDNLPADPVLFNEYHALLVALGKDYCRKTSPRCAACPLAHLCPSAPPA